MITNKRIKYFFILMGILALLLLPQSFIFNDSAFVCIFNHLTDHECPLCGMTRACYHMVRLQPAVAFNYNPLALFFPVLVGTEILNDLDIPGMHRIRKIFWITFAVVIIVLFVFRIL